MYRRIFTITLLVIALSMLAGCKTAEKKPATQGNKTTAPKYVTLRDEATSDTHKDGCASCHKKGTVDRSLAAYVKKINNHPSVTANSVEDCYGCHEANKNYDWYKKFYKGLHRTHWDSKAFYDSLKGRCFSCHTAEANGVSGIKGYTTAGNRSVVQAPATKKEVSEKTTKVTPETSKKTVTPEEKKTTPEGSGTTSNQSTIPESALPGFVEIPIPTP